MSISLKKDIDLKVADYKYLHQRNFALEIEDLMNKLYPDYDIPHQFGMKRSVQAWIDCIKELKPGDMQHWEIHARSNVKDLTEFETTRIRNSYRLRNVLPPYPLADDQSLVEFDRKRGKKHK